MICRVLLLCIVAYISQSCTQATQLKLMTYNIRLDVASDGENAWPQREDFLISQLLFLEPDVLGVQEARPNQMQDLSTALTTYAYIGHGRDGGDQGEYSAIYYNKEVLRVEQQATFWLSATPSQVSKGWDAAYPRICTYGLFTHLHTKQKFWVFNTHLDHRGAVAQKEGLQLILARMDSLNTQKYPVVLMGDFNVEPDSEALAATQSRLADSKTLAQVVFGPDGTFNGFQYQEPVSRRIDYILLSPLPGLMVRKYAVFSSAIDFKFPSDHFPVYVEIRLP